MAEIRRRGLSLEVRIVRRNHAQKKREANYNKYSLSGGEFGIDGSPFMLKLSQIEMRMVALRKAPWVPRIISDWRRLKNVAPVVKAVPKSIAKKPLLNPALALFGG